MNTSSNRPSLAWIAGSWAALALGSAAFLIGLNNANIELNEKGYYFTVLVYGLFSAISLQKTVRDRDEGLPVTNLYYGLCWGSLMLALTLLGVGLYNAEMLLSEKGFYGMAFTLSLFAASAVQKNTRDK